MCMNQPRSYITVLILLIRFATHMVDDKIDSILELFFCGNPSGDRDVCHVVNSLYTKNIR
jgi:hypothetical protein